MRIEKNSGSYYKIMPAWNPCTKAFGAIEIALLMDNHAMQHSEM